MQQNIQLNKLSKLLQINYNLFVGMKTNLFIYDSNSFCFHKNYRSRVTKYRAYGTHREREIIIDRRNRSESYSSDMLTGANKTFSIMVIVRRVVTGFSFF